MRILHTSDLHLGISLMGRSLLEHQQWMIEELAQVAKREQVAAVLISGDIFDRSVVAAEVISLYNQMATKLCLELGVKVFLIAGNHDGAERLASCSALPVSYTHLARKADWLEKRRRLPPFLNEIFAAALPLA